MSRKRNFDRNDPVYSIPQENLFGDDPKEPNNDRAPKFDPPKPPDNNIGVNPSGADFESHFRNLFRVHPGELELLLKFYPNFETRNQVIIFCLGVLLTPITLLGNIFGFVRSYERFEKPLAKPVEFWPMKGITRVAMLIGALVLWACVLVAVIGLVALFKIHSSFSMFLTAYLTANFIISLVVFGSFKYWQYRTNTELDERRKFGTARFADTTDLAPYENQKGIYIGGTYNYSNQGHILTTAGSRSGKFTNLIAPNLLGYGDIDGSWVIIDPKGEVAAVTHDYQAKSGQNVIVLNPWGLLPDNLPPGQNYNPMDILDTDSPHLVDDCHMLAEMLVPVEAGRNKFFSDSARAIVSGLILYIAVSETKTSRSLATLWKWVRYPQEMWDRILSEMQNYDASDANSDNLMFASTEIEKLAKSGSNTWGSILATVLQATDFLKSPALKKSMQGGFDPKTLAHKNTTLYVIIPADKLQSHSRWLRLVVTSSMRAVIRKPNKRVCFILDEFAALGYLPEIETALGAYAGFNVTVWPILQSLVQLQALYEKNWEVFIGNTAVRHYFGIHNNHDAEYVSKAIGKESHVVYSSRRRNKEYEVNQRDLITPDELRIASGKQIFCFVDDLPPAILPKVPYYQVIALNDVAWKNPYL